jgi:hypothetical protein
MIGFAEVQAVNANAINVMTGTCFMLISLGFIVVSLALELSGAEGLRSNEWLGLAILLGP